MLDQCHNYLRLNCYRLQYFKTSAKKLTETNLDEFSNDMQMNAQGIIFFLISQHNFNKKCAF